MATTVDSSLEWAFHPACPQDGAVMAYDPEAATRSFGRPLTGGELGCYESHVDLWRWFLASEHDQLVILEDDVAADWIALQRLAACDWRSLEIDILRMFSLYSVRNKPVVEGFLAPHSHLLQIRGKLFGTQAYGLTRRAATVLLENSLPIRRPIDWMMMRYWEYGIPIFLLHPSPVFERQLPSSIDMMAGSGAAPSPLRDRVRRMGVSLRERAMREWVDRSQGSRSIRRTRRIIEAMALRHS